MKTVQYALLVVAFAASSPLMAQPKFEEIVKKAEAQFEPGTARPGQTVTLKVTLKLLDGWHTYPLEQPEKSAKLMTNKLTFPEEGPIVYVGAIEDPPGAKEKEEPMLFIKRMLYYPGGAVWERKAIVAPTAPAGAVTSKVKLKVLVCNKDNCLPPRPLELEATLKIAGEPVAVEPKFKAEFDKAQKK